MRNFKFQIFRIIKIRNDTLVYLLNSCQIMLYQPFIIDKNNDTKQKSLVYVGISFDIQETLLQIIVTDIYTFCKEFKVNSNFELLKLTYTLNSLTLDDLNISDSIIMKLKLLSKLFKPTIQNDDDSNLLIELNNDLNIITFIHNDFKYKFPIKEMNEIDSLKIIKELYLNLEKYSQFQTNLINRFSNLIKIKDNIINTLSFSYYEKINPIIEKPENLNDILNDLSKIFVRKDILKYFKTDINEEYNKNINNNDNDNILIFDPKWQLVWNKIIEKDDHLSIEEENIQIEEFGESNEDKTTSNLILPQPKVKRKLQGLLRRQQKKKKDKSE